MSSNSNTKIVKQNAAKVRKLLRYAGPMNRVRIEYLRKHTGLTAAAVIECLDFVETASFKMMRVSGQGSCVAWAA